MIDFSGLRHVVPDEDSRIGRDGFVGMTEYMQDILSSYRQSFREGVEGLLAEVATIDAEMARKVANTDVAELAEGLFRRDMLPKLEAYFEQGREIFAGRSVNH